ncbi:uncharacterized protein LOC144425797 [Styela clava]
MEVGGEHRNTNLTWEDDIEEIPQECLICKNSNFIDFNSSISCVKKKNVICPSCNKFLNRELFRIVYGKSQILISSAPHQRFYFNIRKNLSLNGTFYCCMCGKPFNNVSNFIRHLRRHICWRRTYLNNNFHNHLLKHYAVHTKNCLKMYEGYKEFEKWKNSSDEIRNPRKYLRRFLLWKRKHRHRVLDCKKNIRPCGPCHKKCTSALSHKIHIKTHNTGHKRRISILTKRYIKRIGKTKKTCHISPKDSDITKQKVITPNKAKPIFRLPENKNGNEKLCYICNKQFSSRSCLVRHVKLVHEGEKPYKCEQCYNRFADRNSLNRHMAKHTGVPLPKTHECVICRKSFTRKSILNRHMRSHGDKDFICSHCHKAFTHQKILDRHITTHILEKCFRCTQCQQNFLTKSNLERHIKIHTNNKPFQCENCNKTFRQKGNLKSHERTHTGLKPFKCEKCSRSFAQSGNLKQHLLIHDGKRPQRIRVRKIRSAECIKSRILMQTDNDVQNQVSASEPGYVHFAQPQSGDAEQDGKSSKVIHQTSSELPDGDIIQEAVCSAEIVQLGAHSQQDSNETTLISPQVLKNADICPEKNSMPDETQPAIFLPTAVQNIPGQDARPLQNIKMCTHFVISSYNPGKSVLNTPVKLPLSTTVTSVLQAPSNESRTESPRGRVKYQNVIPHIRTMSNVKYVIAKGQPVQSYTLHGRGFHSNG